MQVNKSFLFGLAHMGGLFDEKGIVTGHDYSIMEAKELDHFRLLKIRYARQVSPPMNRLSARWQFMALSTLF